MTDFLDGVRMGSFDTEYDDDTIEMVLSESAMHLLEEAATQAESAGPVASPAVKEPEAQQSSVQAYPGVGAVGVAGAQAAAKVQAVAEADAIAKAQPIAEMQATPKVQPVAKALVTPEAQTTTEAPAAVARQQPIAKDQVPQGYRPPMSTLRFALILSLVAVASALLTAGTYFIATRAPPPVKVVTIRVPAAPAPAVAATSRPPAATAPPSPLPAAAATAATAATAVGAAPAPSTDQPATVRFVNPFDKKEVFEFPPGTSQADARDAVADLLAERARDRRGELSKAPRRNGKTADSGAPVITSGLSPRS
jgi:hypothetical protein